MRRRFIDQPNLRSSHNLPTPRGGGISIMVVSCATLIVVGWMKSYFLAYILAGAAFLLATISLKDDFRPVPARIRFLAQSVAALLVIGALWPALKSIAPFGWALVVLLGGSFVWLVGYTNAFNFMDGINGISGGQAVVTGIGTACMAGSLFADFHHPLVLSSTAVAGAACGFLPHNFPRARMFMGDVGSAPLGFLLAAFALAVVGQAGLWTVVPMLLIHANYILDTAITLSRRIARGEVFYEAHREHFYQRLVRSGKSHTFVMALEMTLQGVTVALAFLYLRSSPITQVSCAAMVILLWAAFFMFAEITFRGTRGQPDSHPAAATV